MGKNLYKTFTVNCIEKTKIKKKRPGMAHFFIKSYKNRKTLKLGVGKNSQNTLKDKRVSTYYIHAYCVPPKLEFTPRQTRGEWSFIY